MRLNIAKGEAREGAWLSLGAIIVAVIIGGGWPVVPLIGNVQLVELIALVVFLSIVVASPASIFRHRIIVLVFLSGILWLLAQSITDLMRDTSDYNSVRGISNIGMFIVLQACCAAFMLSSRNAVAVVVCAFYISKVLSTAIDPSMLQKIDPWKFGYGSASIGLVLAGLSAVGASALWASFVLMGISLVSIGLGARSIALLAMLPALLVFYSEVRSGPAIGRRLAGTVCLVVIVAAMAAVYMHAVNAGFFSGEVQEKFESQLRAGLILGGRSELWGSVPAIIDSPIIGHGSWAENERYVDVQIAHLRESGVEVYAFAENALIPTHSHIFGAWVQSGVVGALYWMFMLWLLLKALLVTTTYSGAQRLLFQFILFSQVWAVLFSPLGLGSRVSSAMATSLAIYLIYGRREVSSNVNSVLAR